MWACAWHRAPDENSHDGAWQRTIEAMRNRVNAFAGLGGMGSAGRAVAIASALALGACGTSQRLDDGGSRVEYIPSRPGKRPGGKPPAVLFGEDHAREGELGRGTVATELLAGARRLLDVELPGGSERFEAHLRVVAMWDGVPREASAAQAGDVVVIDGRLAVCERVAADGQRTFIGPDGDDVVRRFVVPESDID